MYYRAEAVHELGDAYKYAHLNRDLLLGRCGRVCLSNDTQEADSSSGLIVRKARLKLRFEELFDNLGVLQVLKSESWRLTVPDPGFLSTSSTWNGAWHRPSSCSKVSWVFGRATRSHARHLRLVIRHTWPTPAT